MLPLQSSLDVLADVGAVLETLADGIRGAVLVAEDQIDGAAFTAGWASSASIRNTLDAAEMKAVAIVDTMLAIRAAIHQAGHGYMEADLRSARRSGAIGW